MMRICSIVTILTFTCASAASGQSVCARRLLTPDEVSGILSEPIVGTKDVPGDPQGCNFQTASFPAITVVLRPGHGRAAITTWSTGQILPTKPLAGVGDRALWVPDSREVIADKNNVLCDITARAAERDLAQGVSDQTLQKRLGDLCNKIYSRLTTR